MRRASKERQETPDRLESLELGDRKVREERKERLAHLELLDPPGLKDPREMTVQRVTLVP